MIVRHLGAARRMQPDRRAELVHLLPERQVLRPVERLAGDVGVDLHAERAVLDRAFGLGRRRRRGASSESCATQPGKWSFSLAHSSAKPSLMMRQNSSICCGRLGELLDRRLRVGQDLLIVLVAVDDLLAHVDVVERRQRAHALAHVLVVAGDLVELVEEFLREEMRVGVDPHLRVLRRFLGSSRLRARFARWGGSSGGVVTRLIAAESIAGAAPGPAGAAWPG